LKDNYFYKEVLALTLMEDKHLLPNRINVRKNLTTKTFAFDVKGGFLKEEEKILFTDNSDSVILKGFYGHTLNYIKQPNVVSSIEEGIPFTSIYYISATRNEQDRRR
jgi:hypothetical protein